MGVSPAKFSSAGQSSQHYIPGVYSRRNVVGAGTGVSSGNLAIIGLSEGGEPKKLLCVSDKSEAKEALLGGDLLDAVCHAFNGSNTFVPQQVFCMRVNQACQSSLTLSRDNGTTLDDIITIKSADYGVHMNQLKMELRDGGTGVSVSYKGDEVSVNNIGRESLNLVCIDSDADVANCKIDGTGMILSAQTSAGDDIADACLQIKWADCARISDLAAKINDTGEYTAKVLDASPDAKSEDLDYADVSVKGAPVILKSDACAFLEALRSIQYIGEAKFVEGAVHKMPSDTNGYVYFSGGDDKGATTDDYISALESLETEDIQIIATPVTSPAIHSLIADHCVSMSTVDKKHERTFWVGMAQGAKIDDAIAEAKTLNTELGSVIMTGAVATDPLTGESVKISPALLACKCAGIESALGVSNPLTNKTIKVSSFDKKYKASELNKMIAGGVMPFGENEDGELVCIRAMTCYQGDSLILNERSMIRSVLYMDRDLRKAYSRRIGTNAAPNESEVIGVLKAKARSWLDEDLITLNGSDLVFNIKVKFDGDKTYISFDRYVRAPNNFMFITATNKVYSSTVEV